MKEEKTIHTKRYMQVEGEFTTTIYKCNKCGCELNTQFSTLYGFQEYKVQCSLCNSGHWCDQCCLQVLTDHASTYNDWEAEFLRVCPACQKKHQPLLTELTKLEKEIDGLEDKRSQLHEQLYQLKEKKEQ